MLQRKPLHPLSSKGSTKSGLIHVSRQDEEMIAKKVYMRPVYCGRKLVSIAVCTTKGALLEDSQVLEHFNPHDSGVFIRAWFMDYPEPLSLSWGKPLYSSVRETQ